MSGEDWKPSAHMTAEESADLRRLEDKVSNAEVWRVATDELGLTRTAELLGWLVFWELQRVESVTELRKALEAHGRNRRTAYRAASDLQRLQRRLLQEFGDRIQTEDEVSEQAVFNLFRRLAQMPVSFLS